MKHINIGSSGFSDTTIEEGLEKKLLPQYLFEKDQKFYTFLLYRKILLYILINNFKLNLELQININKILKILMEKFSEEEIIKNCSDILESILYIVILDITMIYPDDIRIENKKSDEYYKIIKNEMMNIIGELEHALIQDIAFKFNLKEDFIKRKEHDDLPRLISIDIDIGKMLNSKFELNVKLKLKNSYIYFDKKNNIYPNLKKKKENELVIDFLEEDKRIIACNWNNISCLYMETKEYIYVVKFIEKDKKNSSNNVNVINEEVSPLVRKILSPYDNFLKTKIDFKKIGIVNKKERSIKKMLEISESGTTMLVELEDGNYQIQNLNKNQKSQIFTDAIRIETFYILSNKFIKTLFKLNTKPVFEDSKLIYYNNNYLKIKIKEEIKKIIIKDDKIYTISKKVKTKVGLYLCNVYYKGKDTYLIILNKYYKYISILNANIKSLRYIDSERIDIFFEKDIEKISFSAFFLTKISPRFSFNNLGSNKAETKNYFLVLNKGTNKTYIIDIKESIYNATMKDIDKKNDQTKLDFAKKLRLNSKLIKSIKKIFYGVSEFYSEFHVVIKTDYSEPSKLKPMGYNTKPRYLIIKFKEEMNNLSDCIGYTVLKSKEDVQNDKFLFDEIKTYVLKLFDD